MERDKGQILLYQTPDGESRIEVTLQGETVWLSLDQMAELFQRNKSTISRHIKNVFEEGELQPDATVAFFATVQNEGKRKVERNIAYYNLDMIISVGYRVHSYRGVQFRMWAPKVLKEYIVKGFALNDNLLKRTGWSEKSPRNILTKTCRGKVMKEKLNCVKYDSSLFILHSSFCERPAFTARKVRFDRAKAYVSSYETWSFTR